MRRAFATNSQMRCEFAFCCDQCTLRPEGDPRNGLSLRARVTKHDEQLITRVANGDEKAFQLIYEEHRGAVRAYLLRQPGITSEDAEDLILDVFYAAWISAAHFRLLSAIDTWLIGIAKNVLGTHRRKHQKSLTESLDDLEHRLSGVSTPPFEEDFLDQITLKEAMAKLSEMQQETFTLLIVEGRSYKEVSHILGVPESTLRRRVQSIIGQLKPLIGMPDTLREERKQ